MIGPRRDLEAIVHRAMPVSRRSVSLRELLDQVDLRDVWTSLGGGELRSGRGRAFWRSGDGFNVKVTARSWRDFKASEGGGILDLVSRVLGCDRRGAAQWLADRYGVALGRTSPNQIRRLAERRNRARERAVELVAWRDRLVLALRDLRNSAWSNARAIDAKTVRMAPGSKDTWRLVATAIARRRAGDAIDGYVAHVTRMTGHELESLRGLLEETDGDERHEHAQ